MDGEFLAVGATGFVERLRLRRRRCWPLLPAALLILCGCSVAQPAQDETKKPGAELSELLSRVLEANRYWFEGPPERVPGFRYSFVHPQGKPQQFTVADPQTAEVRVKRGITYLPLVAEVIKALADSGSNVATVEAVERSDKEIRIRFRTDGSLSPRLGGGVSGGWSGYLPFHLGNGTIRLDAATLMPIELTSVRLDERRNSETLVTETLSEPFEVDPGHWVPLHVVADVRRNTVKNEQRRSSGHDRFDWAFRVYEPGLWLFDAQLIAEGTAIGYHLEDVAIGESERPLSKASSAAVATIRGSKEHVRSVVDRYIETNRAWLLPDRKKRQGLVYDYTQEDGYRERVIFDHQGNVLVQLASHRQPSKRLYSGSQHLFTADGREVKGMADEPYLMVRALEPASSSLFAGSRVLPCLATGWGLRCASMGLARGAGQFAITVDQQPKKKTWKLTLRPLHGRATFSAGTMLRFTSWANLRRRPYKRCDIEVDRASGLPVMETYFVKGRQEPFCTIRFQNWLDTAEGKAPGKVIGRATYDDEVFRFTGTYRVTGAGLLLLDQVESSFESKGDESTGRVTAVEATDEDYRPLQEALERVDATTQLLANAKKAPRGLRKTVRCRWDEDVPVWLNGKYEHAIKGGGEHGIEPPALAYRDNLGIRDLRPEVLADGKIRVTVNVYSTLYYRGYDFDVTLGLIDGTDQVLAEQTVSEKTQTLDRPEQKQIVFDVDGGVDPDNVSSIAVSLKIKRQWGTLLSVWCTNPSRNNDRESVYLPGARDWGPEQAIGEPANQRSCGDYRHAWSSMTEDGQEEWLELTYRNRIEAVGVNVYETLNPGAICRVTYYDPSGEEQIAWEGDDSTSVDAKFNLGASKIRFGRAVETDRVRVYLDSPRVEGWNEIDAVGLVEAATEEFPEQEHWAVNATASSTFADEPRPETITYQYEGPHTELKYDAGLAHCKRGTWDSEWQVMRFTRPKDKPCLEALRVLGTRGDYRPERTTLYVLDQDMKVLKKLSSGSRIRDRGPVKWYTYYAPSVEVPETFHVAFEFYGPKGRGISLATRRLAEGETGHSYLGEEGQEMKPLAVQGVASDWMIRAYLAAKPNENEEVRRQQFTR